MGQNEPDRKIWWLASYPKSGNTWIRLFINAYVTGFPVNMNSAFEYVMSDLDARITQSCSVKSITRMSFMELVMLRYAILMNIINFSVVRDVVLKTHNAKVALDDIKLIPPILSRGAIYIVRDPRDVVISAADHMGMSIDDTIKAMNNERWAFKNDLGMHHFVSTWSTHVASWVKENENVPVVFIRYEDLVANPRKEFEAIITHGLGMPKIDEDRMNFALEQTKFKNLQEFEKEKGFNEKSQHAKKFFRSGKVGQWVEKLTSSQVRQIEDDHGEMMEYCKYDLSPRITS